MQGSGTVPDDADITWSLSPGSDRFFELQGPVDADQITVVAKEPGDGYLIASVNGVGMTAIPIEAHDLTIYGIALWESEYVYEGKAIEPKIEPSQIMMDLGAFDYKETAAFTEGKSTRSNIRIIRSAARRP